MPHSFSFEEKDPSEDTGSIWNFFSLPKYGLKDPIRGQRKYLKEKDTPPVFPAKDV